jgi:hypothetical protein
MEEHDQRRDRDDRDLRDIIRGRDAHSRIKSRRQEQERMEQERRDEKHYDYYVPFTTNLTDNIPSREDIKQEESKPFPTT